MRDHPWRDGAGRAWDLDTGDRCAVCGGTPDSHPHETGDSQQDELLAALAYVGVYSKGDLERYMEQERREASAAAERMQEALG